MGLTKPTAAMINFSIHNVTDPLVRINSGQTGTNDKDIGFVFERGDDANVALFWDETADQFVLVNTIEDGSTNGDVTISSYADIQVGTINTATLEIGGTAVTSTATELNLLDGVTGTLVTEAGTQTLTNKTLTAPVISSITNTGTLTLPTTTGTVALTSDIPTAVSELTNDSGYSTTTGTVTSVAGTGTVNGLSLSGTVTSSGSLTLGGTFSATVSEISDLTATAAELNTLDGITATTAELNYSDGVTSNIQTQLDAKASLTGTETLTNKTITSPTISNPTLTGTYTFTSDATTTPAMTLTASSLNDGVGALRIDGAQADIFLNPATATHTTVTFAVNSDQRLAFGMDNNSDFYITRRTSSTWYDDTFVLDRDTGLLSVGYGATVAGTLTYATLNDGTTALTSTVAELNYMDGVTSNVQTQLDAKAPTAGPTFTGTDGIVIPSGTTEQRPVSPATGTMRFNTTDGRFEGYNGTAWVPIDTLYS